MELKLSKRDRGDLEAIVRQQRGEARFHRRARMVLLAAEGKSISAIARDLGTCRARVGQWLRRFGEHRLEGLEDMPRSGRPAEIKPQRVKMWCHSDDPAYQEKMRAIVDLYVNLPKGEPVLSIDEKTGMQALSRRRPLQPAAPGHHARFDFEYRRNGTRCLFACFNVGTGKVIGRCTTHRKRPDFLSFMDRVASAYRQRRVHVVLDNLNTHRDTNQGAFMTEWNKRHGGRFVFHYTPTHGSWLNQIELWFCILSRRILRHGNFHSPDELVRAVTAFIKAWNEAEAHPFRWTYDGLPLVR